MAVEGLGASSEAPEWDSLNLNCDQHISPDSLGLHLSDSLGLAPGAGAEAEAGVDAAERRSKKLMRMVARAIADD